MPDARARSTLDDLAALGPFFAVGSHSPGAAPAAPWRPGGELAGPSDALAARVAAVRNALAARFGRDTLDVEARVAGSAAHLGLVARLIAPALGAHVLRCPIDLRLGGLWWQDELGGAMPVSLPASAAVASAGIAPEAPAPGGIALEAPAPVSIQPEAAAPEPIMPAFAPVASGDDLARGERDWEWRLLDETIAPFTAAIAQLVPVSRRVLWGNVASAVNTAAVQVARQRPDLAPNVWQAASRLLADPRLSGEPCPPGPAFRRSSCCLFYRLAPGDPAALCGDCVLGARRAR